MVPLTLIFYVIAAILFGLAFFNVGSRFDLIAGGLFFWVCTELIGKVST